MRLLKAVRLINEYAICRECGNGNIGNGEGSIIAEGSMFRRTCKCGWSVEVKDEEAVSEAGGLV